MIKSNRSDPGAELHDTIRGPHGIRLTVVRLDRIDPVGSGNKSFKLKYNLQEARAQGARRLISFGGAYSNHIHALALLGQEQGFATLGLIRGEPVRPLNATLADAEAAGMQLHYLSRSDYRRRGTSGFLSQLRKQLPQGYWIPEGAGNLEGVRGCMEIASHIPPDSDLVVLPCATGSTLAALAAACPQQVVIGVAVLKGASDLEQRVRGFLGELTANGVLARPPENWSVTHAYHQGGYARVSGELAKFILAFQRETGIAVEPVYSAKMFYAVYQMLASGQISPSSRVTVIHTGGMQGVRGMRARMRKALKQASAPMTEATTITG